MATKVWNAQHDTSYARSFFTFEGDKIVRLDEYGGEFDKIPQWRRDKK